MLLLLLSACGITQVAEPGAPRIEQPRSHFTLTALSDGRALVAGGDGTASAEIYDGREWSRTGALHQYRYAHTATLLPDGRVLVAGGSACRANCTDANSLHSAELYDPATGTWSRTGDMAAARMDHVAIALPDGRVLVAGGSGVEPGGTPAPAHHFTSLRSAEIYDPASGTWSPIAPMRFTRERAFGFARPDGSAFVVGGSTSEGDWRADFDQTAALVNDTRRSVERYDLTQGTWSLGASMPEEYTNIEEWGGQLPDGRFLRIDGWEKEKAALYDPVADRWDTRVVSGHGGEVGATDGDNLHPNLPLLVLRDGRVLSSGGGRIASQAKTWLFDPATSVWTASGEMGLGRYHHAAVQLTSGRVLVYGGEQEVEPNYIYPVARYVVTSEVYDPAAGIWSPR